MPASKHKFRLGLYSNNSTSESYLDFMQQVHSVEYDLAAKRIIVMARDDIYGLAMHHINKFAKSSLDWNVVIGVNPHEVQGDWMSTRVSHAKVFCGCKLIKHSSGFDYSSAEVVFHRLEIGYQDLYIRKDDIVERAPDTDKQPAAQEDPTFEP